MADQKDGIVPYQEQEEQSRSAGFFSFGFMVLSIGGPPPRPDPQPLPGPEHTIEYKCGDIDECHTVHTSNVTGPTLEAAREWLLTYYSVIPTGPLTEKELALVRETYPNYRVPLEG